MTTPSQTFINYAELIEDAMLNVVRRVLAEVGQNGLLGDHHFYITFDTRHSGLDIPAWLVDIYPDSMTIVLQHRFWNLETRPDFFRIELSFRGERETLTIPYESITTFADPSVNFSLHFNDGTSGEAGTGQAAQNQKPAKRRNPAESKKKDAPAALVRLDKTEKTPKTAQPMRPARGRQKTKLATVTSVSAKGKKPARKPKRRPARKPRTVSGASSAESGENSGKNIVEIKDFRKKPDNGETV